MRNRFHSLCPYFAMFPEQFVRRHLIWSKPGDLVLDPFSGRGTTLFESLLRGRNALAGDTNPVAVCVSRAKADPPLLTSLIERIQELESRFKDGERAAAPALSSDEFFGVCFHLDTLAQVLYLRRVLDWRWGRTDRFIAALILGCLHGESHRSELALSNRMPRTISTKPAYSVRWWRANGYVAPKRDVFAVLRDLANYRYESELPEIRGEVAEVDARKISGRFKKYLEEVSLVITSPPYLDVTDYREDQWLRLWFLGGEKRPTRKVGSDDRHRTSEKYWDFLLDSWKGVAPLLRKKSHIVIRLGGQKQTFKEVTDELVDSIKHGIGRGMKLISARQSEIQNTQLRSFHPTAEGSQFEFDYHFQRA